MAPNVSIPDGFELLAGRGKENALAALALAEERGLDPTSVQVSTVFNGYLIPKGDSADGEEQPEEIKAPTDSNTHDEIDQFATDNGISFDGIEAKNPESPTKAEKIAAIAKALEAKADDQKGE